MKPKKGKASSKASNVEKNPLPQKNVEVVEENNEEEVDQAEVKTKLVIKKAGKGKKVVKEPVKEEEDGVEDDETQSIEADDDEADVDEADDDEAADDEEADYDLEADNNGEADDDEGGISVDANPSLKSTGLEEPTTPSKVKSGPIPHNISVKKVIHVTKLPKKCKQINIVEAFAKYGAIDQIHIVVTPKATLANVAFKTAKAALAAIEDEKKIKINSEFVTVSEFKLRGADKVELNSRKITVKNINIDTTEEQIRSHFKSCGEIEYLKKSEQILRKPITRAKAIIIFVEKAAAQAALKLNNSILNDSNIGVSLVNDENRKSVDENVTVTLKNKQDIKSIEIAKLKSIFAKCGEIDSVDILCRASILAFVSFKTEEAAKKALKLSGKTVQGVELEIEPYTLLKKWTTIIVKNTPQDCTEEDIKTHFAKAGEIERVTIFKRFATIRFADSDGFCKSFLYTESYLKGNMIFIEPNTARKSLVLNKGPKKPFKRPFQNKGAFNAKKPKLN